MNFLLRPIAAAFAFTAVLVASGPLHALARDQHAGELVLAGPAGSDLVSGLKWLNPQPSFLGDDGDRFDRFAGNSIALDGGLAVVGAEYDDVGGNVDQGSAYVLERSVNSWSVVGKVVASDGTPDDAFGYDLAMDGDTLIVGASGASAAYVFVRTGSTFTQQAKLVAPDGAGGAFGWSVAIAGDVAIVAAPTSITSNGRTGAAYVFTRQSGTWAFQSKLVADDAAVDDFFGSDTALTGNSAVIGAHSRNFTGANQGAAFVFEQNGGIWTQVVRLTASDGAPGDQFGLRLAASGDTVVIGAYTADVGADAAQGAAYTFVRNAGIWTEQAKLTVADGNSGDSFGRSVAIDGDTVVVGAFGADVGATASQGAAYAFVRTAGVWTRQARFDVIGTTSSLSYFGSAAAIDGDSVLVGGLQADVGDHDTQGVAYAYQRTGTMWSAVSSVDSGRGTANEFFGTHIALDGDTAVVGVSSADWNSEKRGVAYVLVRQAGAWIHQATLAASDGATGDGFGVAVAISDDTVVVGAHSDTIGTTRQGSAYVFVRSGTTWAQQAKLLGSDGVQFGQFGLGVAVVGDTALVGATSESVSGTQRRGAAYVFVRTGTIWSQQARLTSGDGAADDRFGESVVVVGETAIVGARWHDVPPNADQGAAYVFKRDGTQWQATGKLVASDGAPGEAFGVALAAAGDTLIVGASGDTVSPAASAGSAYVFVRSQDDWLEQVKLAPPAGVAGDGFGVAVAFSDDVALVGAYGRDEAYPEQGIAYRFARTDVSWGAPVTLGALDPAPGDQFGSGVALDGDTMLVGAPGVDGAPPYGNPAEGAVYVFGPPAIFADGFE